MSSRRYITQTAMVFGFIWVMKFAAPLHAADNFGYTATSSVPFSYVNIAGTGTTILANEDDATATLTLPFGFRFYGVTYTSMCVSTNGLITFSDCPSGDITNLDLTAQSPPGNLPLIAPFWMDLTFALPGSGGIVYQTFGTAPSRRFVVQWSKVFALNQPSPMDFQVILSEGSNKILAQYQIIETGSDAVSKGKSATVGIRGVDGQINGNRIQWSFRTPVLSNGTAIEFAPPQAPPKLTVNLSPSVLWPPDHKLVPVTATITVADASDPNPKVVLVSIVSNEPDNGLDDGDTPNDIQGAVFGTDDRSFLLRAERSGTGTGRVYTVTYKATNASGNATTVSAQVTVPLNQAKQ